MATFIKGLWVKEKQTTKGNVLKVSVNKDVLIKQLQELPANDKGYINWDIWPKSQTDEKGNTHNVVLDEFKPDPSKRKDASHQNAQHVIDNNMDDLPF